MTSIALTRRNNLRVSSNGRKLAGSTHQLFPLTIDERDRFLEIVKATSRISRHIDLFRLAQGEVQYFLPHQILISAWGNFRKPPLKIDVISALPGVRTGQLSDCGIDLLLKGCVARWAAGGKLPTLLTPAATASATSAACDCALHVAMRNMRFILVHCIRNERDDFDTIYVVMNPASPTSNREKLRLLSIADSLFGQLDVAFRRVAALRTGGQQRASAVPAKSNSLSAREQEIVTLISEGKTNAEIAKIIGISSFTVKNHVQRIFRKLDVSNRTEAVAKCRPHTPAT